MARYNRYQKRIEPIKIVETNEPLSPIMISFLEQENQQSLHRLNNKQRSVDMIEKHVTRIYGYKNSTFDNCVNIGYFKTDTKRNFDYSIIVSNDNENWYMLNLTKTEIDWLCKNLEIKLETNYDDLLFKLKQNHFELLLSFKNTTKNFSQIKFNYLWLGFIDLDEIETTHDNWLLNYT